MSKKIAVLIAGDYREFEIAYKSWQFVNLPEVDLYFATWHHTSQYNKKLGINIRETINESTIRKSLPSCKGIDIGSDIVSKISCKSNGERMINRWKAAIRLLKKSGVKYNACMIIRPDLFLNYNSVNFHEWISKIEENVLYTLGDRSTITYFIQDMILIGTPDTIIKLEYLPNNEPKHPYDYDIHYWLAKNLATIFNKIEKIDGIGDGEYAIVRPNSRGKPEINLSIVKSNLLKWNRKLYSMDTIIKEFSGFSGSKVLLIKSLQDFIIRKIDNVERNYEKLKILKYNNFLVPQIIDKEDNILDMEYIQGFDIKTFFKLNHPSKFVHFVMATMNRFKNINVTMKDYTSIYNSQLQWFYGDERLPFTITELIEKLPKILPSTLCHGDFTLDNIIYKEPEFYMIDPSTGVYDSWIFDIAKLRQDLDGKWFLRHKENKNEFNSELEIVKKELQKVFPEAFDDYLYILMLLRVYKYSREDTTEQRILLEEIKRVWK